jgi:hypothetical protein
MKCAAAKSEQVLKIRSRRSGRDPGPVWTRIAPGMYRLRSVYGNTSTKPTRPAVLPLK